MSNWKKIKIIIGVFVVILVTVLTIFFININNSTNKDNNKDQTIVNKLNMDDDFVKIIRITAEQNSDWSKLPLSKSFKKKYNSKYGILGKDDNYTYLSSDSYDSNKLEHKVVLNVDHEYKQEQYYIHYTVNENNELDDVEIVDKKLLYDEYGKEVIHRLDAGVGAIISLCAPYRLEYDPIQYYNVTDKYLEKWAGGFIPQQAIQGVIDIPEIEDKTDNIVYLKSDYPKLNEDESIIIGEGITRYFKVHYFVNEDMWLDDVEVEEVSKAEIDILLKSVK